MHQPLHPRITPNAQSSAASLNSSPQLGSEAPPLALLRAEQASIDWLDPIIQRLPAANIAEATTTVELTKPREGQTDFNLAVTEDHDFMKVMEQFEKTMIKAALERHKTVGECCDALKLPRSTLDSKRRKYGLV